MHFTQALLALSAIAGLTLAAPQPAECQTGIYGPQRVDRFSGSKAEGCQNLDSLEYGSSLKFDGQGVWMAQVFKDKDCKGGSWTYAYADDSRCLDIDQIKSFSVKVQQGKSLPSRCGGYQ
ncbi:hypothetical protein Tdes44962_MAKER07162 [Teratosphaeria destructans]|uniref:Small secreted protein n=1 Tax=Teratosphaeria destructans TaxID=418781 RepID=A0A9W7T087_9PEZI|nr:hypothetical protein Tdes44962_MAKER07162 [Teratosphaeria destructans]